jgi:chromosome segregation ATPase
MMRCCGIWIVLTMLCLAGHAVRAQDQSVEDKLREVLRRTVTDLRAAQDNQAALQAALDQAQKQRDLLQQQVTDLTARLAAQPAQTGPSPQQTADLQQLHDALDALKKQNAELQDGLAHWQAAYRQAAALAQSKDADSKKLATTAAGTQKALGACEAKNTKLIGVANDILHLYQTPQFRAVIRGSWEPLLGFKKVELENIVQDNEDRILDQTYRPGEQPPKE